MDYPDSEGIVAGRKEENAPVEGVEGMPQEKTSEEQGRGTKEGKD